MDTRERIAYHEAAHIVVAIEVGAGIYSHGIDLDAPTSVPGAFGNAGTNLFEFDPTLPNVEQMHDLKCNLAVICAGAASDAKLTGITPSEALENQTSDMAVAKRLLADSPLIAGTGDEREKEENIVLRKGGLAFAANLIDKPDVWAKIEQVAKACIEAGGRLSKKEIEAILSHREDAAVQTLV